MGCPNEMEFCILDTDNKKLSVFCIMMILKSDPKTLDKIPKASELE